VYDPAGIEDIMLFMARSGVVAAIAASSVFDDISSLSKLTGSTLTAVVILGSFLILAVSLYISVLIYIKKEF
jgi:hypothetical protein